MSSEAAAYHVRFLNKAKQNSEWKARTWHGGDHGHPRKQRRSASPCRRRGSFSLQDTAGPGPGECAPSDTEETEGHLAVFWCRNVTEARGFPVLRVRTRQVQQPADVPSCLPFKAAVGRNGPLNTYLLLLVNTFAFCFIS